MGKGLTFIGIGSFPILFQTNPKMLKCYVITFPISKWTVHCHLGWGSSVPGGWRAVPQHYIGCEVNAHPPNQNNGKRSHASIIHDISKYTSYMYRKKHPIYWVNMPAPRMARDMGLHWSEIFGIPAAPMAHGYFPTSQLPRCDVSNKVSLRIKHVPFEHFWRFFQHSRRTRNI